MNQVIPLLRALFGAARSALGYWLLRARCKKLSGRPDPDMYRQAWIYSNRIRWLVSGRSAHANRFRIAWQNYVAAELNKHISDTPSKAEWLIDFEHTELQMIDWREPKSQIVLCVHSKLTFAVVDSLKALGLSPVLVRNFSRRRDYKSLDSVGVECNVATQDIIADNDVFLNIRKAAKSGHIVVVLADFTRRRANTLFHDHFFSTAIVDFATRSRMQLIFSAASVKQDGTIRVEFDCPDFDHDNFSSETASEQFRAFIRGSTRSPADWRAVESPQTIQSPKHQLQDVCIVSN